jgi:hypothetical protein
MTGSSPQAQYAVAVPMIRELAPSTVMMIGWSTVFLIRVVGLLRRVQVYRRLASNDFEDP